MTDIEVEEATRNFALMCETTGMQLMVLMLVIMAVIMIMRMFKRYKHGFSSVLLVISALLFCLGAWMYYIGQISSN